MKLKKFIETKKFNLLICVLSYFIILMLLFAFKSDLSLIMAISAIYFFTSIIGPVFEFLKKRIFYDKMLQNLALLDKKYLILETLSKPDFYEGEILYDILYEINKSMIEQINIHRTSSEDFKEYLEMWIHEIKIPISSLILLCHNHKNLNDKTLLEEIKKLDDYIDQILYYVRSNNTEEDFTIKEISLDKVVSSIALKNKDTLLENKIDFLVNVKDVVVQSDQKWLEFILNQIINNSIKYKRTKVESFIKIEARDTEKRIMLSISDNGIGIPPEDLPRVWNKSFTGTNGRNRTKSTGMGLYIAKKLCDKLGHQITIESEQNSYTKVTIIFAKNDFYKF